MNETKKDTGGNDVDGTWGDYTIQEGENDLFLLNRRNGKKFKFMLQEGKLMSLNVNGTTVANPITFSSLLLHQIHHHLLQVMFIIIQVIINWIL